MSNGMKSPFKETAMIICAAMVALIVLGIAAWVEPASAAVIHARGDHDYPPYEYLENEEPTGFNVDLLKAVAKTMGIEVKINLGPWASVRKQLENGEIDMITGMYYSFARDEKVDFSASFIVVHHNIFTRVDSSIEELADLPGKSVMVQSGDIMHDFALDNLPESAIIEVENQAEALRLLSIGKYDAALLATLQGLYNVQKFGLDNIHSVGFPLLPRDYCFAVREGEAGLLAKLNEGLAIIRKTGEYRRIYDKWFSHAKQSVEDGRHSTFLVAGIALLLIFTLFVVLRARRSRRKKKP